MITRKSKVTCKPVGILPCADPEIYPGILGPERGGGRGIIFVSQFMIIKLCEFSKSEFPKGGEVRTHPTLLDQNMFVLARGMLNILKDSLLAMQTF